MAINDESILTSIKKILGITEEYTVFDSDVMMHINSIFAVLHQLGVGPNDGFFIENKQAKWSDFIQDNKILSSVKSYVGIRVRLIFDPPDRSFIEDSLKRQADELEWRLNAAVDPPTILP